MKSMKYSSGLQHTSLNEVVFYIFTVVPCILILSSLLFIQLHEPLD